jgi:hypothetical protein
MSSYIDLPFVEIEVRLGTQDKHFDTAIDSNYVTKILESLLSYKGWVSIECIDTKEYVNESLKLIESKNNKVLMFKDKVFKETIPLKNCPFDIRFAVYQEFYMNHQVESFKKTDCVLREKKRKSFIQKNFKYDVTHVIETKNNTPISKYEIEIELLVNEDTLKWSNEYIKEFMKCKVYDLVNLIEPSDNIENVLDGFNKLNLK